MTEAHDIIFNDVCTSYKAIDVHRIMKDWHNILINWLYIMMQPHNIFINAHRIIIGAHRIMKDWHNIHLTNLISVHLLCPYNFFVYQYNFTKFCVLTICCISTHFMCSSMSILIMKCVQPWKNVIHTMHENILRMGEIRLHMIFSDTIEIDISEKHH
jgi:hypothetical protein